MGKLAERHRWLQEHQRASAPESRRRSARKAHVVVNYARGKEDAEKIAAAEKAGGKAISVQADVSKQADVDRLFEVTKKTFGTVDVLVNNAGVYEYCAY